MSLGATERDNRMAGFRKAKAEQAFLKMEKYGAAGSGKTFTALLVAEGLARTYNKKIAFVDTEHGTDFYCQPVPERKVHPEAFDFDALYSRSITEIDKTIRTLDPKEYGILVVDSFTHIWEAAKAAYTGKRTRQGGIPLQAWGSIKAPYKKLIEYCMSVPMHFILCARESNLFETDEETGELKAVGTKPEVEGKTSYEPHIVINMKGVRKPDGTFYQQAFIEKDRTGMLMGKTLIDPNFDTLAKPLLKLLGTKQAVIPSEEDVAKQDSESLLKADAERTTWSARVSRELVLLMKLCKSQEALEDVAKAITADMKKKMVTSDVNLLRDTFGKESLRIKGIEAGEASADADECQEGD